MPTETPLPQYQSHKKVWALRIKDVYANERGEWELSFVDPLYAPRVVTADYFRKHQPLPGGYWVQYEDGYESWSPAGAFEAGYTRLNP